MGAGDPEAGHVTTTVAFALVIKRLPTVTCTGLSMFTFTTRSGEAAIIGCPVPARVSEGGEEEEK